MQVVKLNKKELSDYATTYSCRTDETSVEWNSSNTSQPFKQWRASNFLIMTQGGIITSTSSAYRRSYLRTSPSSVKGVHDNTVNNCYHVRLSTTSLLYGVGGAKYKQLYSYTTKFHRCPIPGREELCVFQQIIMDNDGKGFWSISTLPIMPLWTQVNGAQIVHWKVDTKRQVLVGYTWYNGYGGYNYSSYKDGVFGWEYQGKFYSFPFSSPPKLEHNTIVATYPLTKHTVTQVTPDLSDLDIEVLATLIEPRIDAELNQHLPKVCRKAWLDFESFDSNLLVELLDSLAGFSALKDFVPSTLKSFTSFGKRMSANWKRRSINRFFRSTPSGGTVLVSKTDLKHFSIPLKEIPKLVAAGELEYKYGFSLPFKTLSQLWTDEVNKDLWAYALRHDNIMNKIFKPVLRHRENYGKYQISCSIQQSYDVEHLFVETMKALYSSGVLMTFEGIWDLVPLSFVVNWGTNTIKSMVESLDATTISQMVKVDQYSYSLKYEDSENLTIGGSSFEIRLKVYKRIYTRTPPTIGIDLTDIKGNFSIRFLPEAGSLLYLLSSK